MATLGSANSFRITNPVKSYTTYSTSGGTTVLSASSGFHHEFTGTSTQTVRLPLTTTLVNGHQYEIRNRSTMTVTVQTNGSAPLTTAPTDTYRTFTCIDNTLDAAASWSVYQSPPNNTFSGDVERGTETSVNSVRGLVLGTTVAQNNMYFGAALPQTASAATTVNGTQSIPQNTMFNLNVTSTSAFPIGNGFVSVVTAAGTYRMYYVRTSPGVLHGLITNNLATTTNNGSAVTFIIVTNSVAMGTLAGSEACGSSTTTSSKIAIGPFAGAGGTLRSVSIGSFSGSMRGGDTIEACGVSAAANGVARQTTVTASSAGQNINTMTVLNVLNVYGFAQSGFLTVPAGGMERFVQYTGIDLALNRFTGITTPDSGIVLLGAVITEIPTSFGGDSTAIGAFALSKRSNQMGFNNVAFGYRALASQTGDRPTIVSRLSVEQNTVVGRDCAAGQTTASYNVAVGSGAVLTNSNGSYITTAGFESQKQTTLASSATASMSGSTVTTTVPVLKPWHVGYTCFLGNSYGGVYQFTVATYVSPTSATMTGTGGGGVNMTVSSQPFTMVWPNDRSTTAGYRALYESQSSGTALGYQALLSATVPKYTTGTVNTNATINVYGEGVAWNPNWSTTAATIVINGTVTRKIATFGTSSLTTTTAIGTAFGTGTTYEIYFGVTTNQDNVAVGANAGSAVTSGFSNVYIGGNTGSTRPTESYNIVLSDSVGTAKYTLPSRNVQTHPQLSADIHPTAMAVYNKPLTKNTASYTLADTDSTLIFTTTNCTITFPAASLHFGRIVYFTNVTATSVTSGASNVVPLNSVTPGTVVLPGSVTGEFAMIQSDGFNWITMMSNF